MNNKLVFGLILGTVAGLVLAYGAMQFGGTPQQEGKLQPQEQEQGLANGYGLGYRDGTGGGTRRNIDASNCLGDECLMMEDVEFPVGELDSEVEQALDRALQDEYHARAVYAAVIEELGAVRPFSMIIRAEEQHINALKAVYDRYGLDIPEEEPLDFDAQGTLADMCAVGVDAEIANAALYRDELLPVVGGHEDIIFVFTNLMNASQEKHLPAFERCSK